jgi:hypothetical protein
MAARTKNGIRGDRLAGLCSKIMHSVSSLHK